MVSRWDGKQNVRISELALRGEGQGTVMQGEFTLSYLNRTGGLFFSELEVLSAENSLAVKTTQRDNSSSP